MKKLLLLPALTLTFGLAACGGGEKNEAIVNDSIVLNADEGAVIGNDAVLATSNEVAPLNFSDSGTGNTLSNAH